MIDPIDKHVGARIRARRMEKGLSLVVLAEALGVSAPQLQKYETGTNRVSASRMHAIGGILQVEPAYFFFEMGETDEGPVIDGEVVETTAIDPDVKRLAAALARIKSRSLRRSIIQLIENIAVEHET